MYTLQRYWNTKAGTIYDSPYNKQKWLNDSNTGTIFLDTIDLIDTLTETSTLNRAPYGPFGM